jgi:hypothetical protein
MRVGRNMDTKKTQKEVVEQRLRETGAIDNFYCIHNRITLRLGAIIFVLKEEGWVFDEWKSGFIEGTKNWRYVLKSSPKPKQLNLL